MRLLSKKAVSSVVAIVLIIMIVVVAIGIIWMAVLPMVKKGVSMDCSKVDLSIANDGYTCYSSESSVVPIQVKKGPNNVKIIGVRLILSSGGNSQKYDSYFDFQPNSGKTFYLNATGLSNIEVIGLVPYYLNGKSQQECPASYIQPAKTCISGFTVPASDALLTPSNVDIFNINLAGNPDCKVDQKDLEKNLLLTCDNGVYRDNCGKSHTGTKYRDCSDSCATTPQGTYCATDNGCGISCIGTCDPDCSCAKDKPSDYTCYSPTCGVTCHGGSTFTQTFPQFSTYQDNNAALSGSGTGLFNVTVANTNGTVFLIINNTNVRAINISANVYSANYYFGAGGTFSYVWGSWSNSNGWNNSAPKDYVVVSIGQVFPRFSNYQDNNGTLTASGIGHFNVTVLNGNGAVSLNINGVNVTATNATYGGNIYNATYNFGASGAYPYRWYSWGNDSSHFYGFSADQYYVVKSVLPVYPQFSNYQDDNATIIAPGKGSFNVAVANTNGTVLLNINGVSILATSLGSGKYGANYSFTSGGTYSYNWSAYGNGINSDLNNSASRSYFAKGHYYTWQYAENANSNIIGGSGSPNYFNDGKWDDGYPYYYILINYTKPSNALNTSLWLAKFGRGDAVAKNFSIPISCWSADVNKLMFRVGSNSGNSTSNYPLSCSRSDVECRNASGWVQLGVVNETSNPDFNKIVGAITDVSLVFDSNWGSWVYYSIIGKFGCDNSVGRNLSCAGWYSNTPTETAYAARIYEEAMWWKIDNVYS